MNEFELCAFGRPVCSLDAALIGEIMKADTSSGQQEEYGKIMNILRGWSAVKGGRVCIDVGNVLADGLITAEKTRAMPILLSAVRQQGALRMLPAEIARTMVFYSNMLAVSMESRYKSLVQLQRFSEALCSILDDICAGGTDCKKAVENAAKALPEKMIPPGNSNDIELLRLTVKGVKTIISICGSSEPLERFIADAERLIETSGIQRDGAWENKEE